MRVSSNDYKEFRRHMLIYEAFENSSIGQLIKDGVMHMVVSSNSDKIVTSHHPLAQKYDYNNLESYGNADNIITSILDAIDLGITLLQDITKRPVVIDNHRYAYLVFNKDEYGVRTLIFGTVYSRHEIFMCRQANKNIAES